jgi:zinc transport system substrate-binding protein
MKKLILLLATFSLLSCKENADKPKDSEVRIVSTSPILDHLVMRTTHGLSNFSHTTAINTQGKCLHDHAISMEEIRTLCGASLVVANGLGYEPFLQQAMKQCPNVEVIYAFDSCSTLQSNGEVDPHAWFGRNQVACAVGQIGKSIAAQAPNQKEAIQTLTARAQSELNGFWHSTAQKYAKLRGTQVVVFHSAYNYLIKEFGLEVIASISEETEETTPSAKETAKLIQTIRNKNISILLAGQSELPEIANMVSKESGARLVPMFTMLEPMDTNDQHAYENTILENMRRISQ